MTAIREGTIGFGDVRLQATIARGRWAARRTSAHFARIDGVLVAAFMLRRRGALTVMAWREDS